MIYLSALYVMCFLFFGTKKQFIGDKKNDIKSIIFYYTILPFIVIIWIKIISLSPFYIGIK